MVTSPQRLYAGDSLTWIARFAAYPASAGWQLRYTLTSAQQVYSNVFTVSSLSDDFRVSDDFSVALSPLKSATLAAGDYVLFATVEKDNARHTVQETRFTVLPAITEAQDRRTQAERTLSAIENLLEGKASDDQQMIQYAGRTLSRYTFEQLAQIRSRLRRTVARQHARKAGAKPFIGAVLR